MIEFYILHLRFPAIPCNENILNIKYYKTLFAFIFITFRTQKLNKQIKTLFHSLLVIFFFHHFPSITSSYKLFSSWPAVARNPGSPNELFSSWPSFARNPCPPDELFSP